ncbi:hypothetical protein Prudu_001673 [Prunus dulcis]|uniref:SREBP regulating gene protein n=1 Tax=Prunus dulcis TaxID=3755 RepID=A0A4Y1QP42_PRUDU|nr:hypothetical protein Prudu_001673 [Prunus dulcis]
MNVKVAKPATAGKYSNVFDFCAGRCRHNSESVVHENAYLSDFHHCFSLPSNSSAANYTFLEARLNGINVLVGSMQKYMSCKGTCLASIGPDQPAEVVDDAPEDLYMTLNGALISLITFRILEHACLLKHNQCFLVMVHISIPGDSALVHSAVSGFPIKGMNCGDYVSCMQVSFLVPLGLVFPSWKIKIHFAPSFTMARLAHCKFLRPTPAV